MKRIYIPPVISLAIIIIVSLSATLLIMHTVNKIEATIPTALAEG